MPAAIQAAVAQASAAAQAVRGTTSPNPPVGAVILNSAATEVLGVGATQPPGGPHAEIMALQAAGEKTRGAIAVVTLEPCNHYGRTGPCSKALLAAGISKLYYVNDDPIPAAHGGADFLRENGVEVQQIAAPTAELQPWLKATKQQRVHVTAKFAQTLDGFTAAKDGSSKWITGPIARAHVHQDRRRRDAIIIGTVTALADNPALTARDENGELFPEQPQAVVIGSREVKTAAPALVARGFLQYPDLPTALDALWELGCRDVLIEGGATLLTSAFKLGVVDAIQAYIAPLLLGEGRGVLTAALSSNIGQAKRWEPVASSPVVSESSEMASSFEIPGKRVRELGPDILVELINPEIRI